MKLKLISLFVIAITLCSCQSLKLSKLTKDIVDLYIKQSKERIEDLIVYTWEDDAYIGFSIYNENPREYVSCGDNWWGIVRYRNHDVVIFGAPVQYYFTVKNITPQERACRECDMFTFYDPTEWHITLYKNNLEVCDSLTDKYNPDLPIDDLKELVEAYIHK
jgi:hypothetical protein